MLHLRRWLLVRRHAVAGARAPLDDVVGVDAELSAPRHRARWRRSGRCRRRRRPSGPSRRWPRPRPRAGHAGRQHSSRYAVGLGGEAVPRRHGHDAGGDALLGEGRPPRDAHRDLAAGADEHESGLVGVARRTRGAHRSHGRAVGARPGRPGGDRTSAVGPSWSTAMRHACGRLVGVGRADHAAGRAWPAATARCSMGWWVGPSSPSPTESWVNTKTTLALRQRRQANGGRSSR